VSAPLLASALQDAAAIALPGAGLASVDAARAAARAMLSTREHLVDARAEAWRYTSLRALEAQALPHARRGVAAIDTACLPVTHGARLVFVDGCFDAASSRLDGLPAGVSCKPLEALDARDWAAHPVLLQVASGADALAPLNLALASAGVLLEVADGVHAEAPLDVIYASSLGMPVAWHARSAIRLGKGARLTLREWHLGTGSGLATVQSHVRLDEDARLDLVQQQEAPAALSLLRRDVFNLAARAQLRLHMLELGAALSQHALVVELGGIEAQAELRQAVALAHRQHADLGLDLRHAVGRTRSDVRCRAVVTGRARAVLQGAITIAAGADGSDAALSTQNLLLSDQAEIDARPVMEIHADEVRAAHGASVGQLDSAMLFYLRARGLPEAAARALLTGAHCRAVLEDIAHEGLRAAAQQALESCIAALG
jgi:Fe-S cluster assembly protein SufD